MSSIDWTGFFTMLGRCVYWSNTLLTNQNTLFLAPTTGEADNLLTQYESNRDLVTNFQNQVNSQAVSMSSWVGQVVQIATSTLQSLQADLNAPTNNVNQIIPLLAAQMVIDSQTIEHTVITTPVVTPSGSNVGNGVLLVSIIDIFGNPDQRITPETVSVRCTSDQWTGTQPGAEQFSITGLPTFSPNVYGSPGHGQGPTIRVADSQNQVTNGNFETFNPANTPQSWTRVSGTIGTNIKKSTTAHSGSAALEFDGDA